MKLPFFEFKLLTKKQLSYIVISIDVEKGVQYMIKFADRIVDLKGSAIREVLKFLSRPGVISFAGGMPAPETYPAAEFSEIIAEILRDNPATAFQYGITEGYSPLIEQTSARLSGNGIGCVGDSVIIVSGGQQAIELVTKSLINEGDGIVCECPSFIGALNAFRSYGAKLYPVPMDGDGMNIEALNEVLSNNKNIKFIYTIPTFQNPTGITMPIEKRRKILEIAEKHGVFILEDDPYWELRFKGQAVPSIKSLDDGSRVLYAGTYSKTIAPGLRVGFLCAPSEITEKAVVCKQVSDVHANVLAQMAVSKYINEYDFDAHIKSSAALNGEKCALMRRYMADHFPGNVSCTDPEGGLFIWCDINDGSDSREFSKRCLERDIAIVSGATAMPDTSVISSAFRLNFSMASDENIEKGIKILGEMLK